MTRAQPYDRETALDAALNLFWQKGYHATSLKDLEAALAMKPGSIYAAFKSKEGLYLSALERYFHRNRDGLRALAAQGGSPLAALAGHLRSFGRQQAEESGHRACMLVKTLLDVTEQDGAIGLRARGYLDEMTAEITAIFEAARDAGELPEGADPVRLARKYQADMTALRIEAHRGGDPAALAALADDMARDVERLRLAESG
ncbi:TetR family transcriptional regulator [Limimaricola soesokkakensis]|uniref:HTH-type transcriptional repressor ComR n=1 Tax=Limimaricola soesokkakensis TaxID=1343159 RepID=A0A1X6ZD02_9RHOB|nr:TetR/AcrR family transcriptional regulator [Limimaricola soesokkakensis]PSK86348.1 TetR family transcriptional regulator [Limimaricola soesokkakensis]SLN47314.1 HTH-type transcriptional repressor ComR [Limimaricola soesokkakensis]